jgi:hypothetical protein
MQERPERGLGGVWLRYADERLRAATIRAPLLPTSDVAAFPCPVSGAFLSR